MSHRPLRPLTLLAAVFALGLALPRSAEAVEFRLDGQYRFRANLFHSLSLDEDHPDYEGTRAYLDHRLRLIPHIRLNPGVHVYVDFDVMDALRFGDNPQVLDAVGAVQPDGTPFSEPVPLSGSVLPGSDYRESLFVRRAWVELYTKYVDFKVGRMGSHWGMGLLANDGNCDTCDYGDTVDRIMVSTSALDPVRLSLAIDTRAEGFINRDDDTHSFLFTGGYLGEVHAIGAYVRWTRQPSHSFNLVHGDIWGRTKLGPLSLELEAMILGGTAETTDIGVEALEVLAGGGAMRARLEMDPIDVGFEFGFASGDSDPTDNVWNTLTFDRDHDIGLVLFELPMPQYQWGDAADELNGNIDRSRAVTGEGISNAFYLRPSFHVLPRPDLRLGVALAAAFPLVREAFEGEPAAYGMELDLEGYWTAWGNFEIGGRFGIFVPGDVYGEGLVPVVAAEGRALVRF